ncbi:MAG: malectin domain-containing carbohydrate-binding protein, partial [Candidatus Poribacteria bacterium]
MSIQNYNWTDPNGKYLVRILFAEIYWESSDAEEEDVYIQGDKVLSHFNIFDEAG